MSADRTSDRQSEGRSARSNSRRRSTTDAGGRGRSDTISFRDRFDLLRVRVYAFLLKEETKLDECQVSFARNHYIDDNTMEHTLEVRAQAQDFMEKIDDLLDESYGPYTDPLRGFWKDCSDIDEKAQKLYNSYQRQGKSRRRRGSSQRRPSATTTPRRTSSQEPRSTLNSSRHHIHEDAEDSLGNSRSVKDHRDLYRGVDPRDRRQSTEGSATPRGGRRASPARHVDPHRTTSPRNNNNTAAAVEQPSTTERRNSHRNVRNPAPATIRARRSSSVSERS
ncbi:hypothetical protein ADEAN_000926900 [Angomonas deanei]|uniref:Uncharacterized protein n=1 Tax=Angomonas deanei TaxID=59799 RepID=A0A7G2CRX8_9TRYP|nr:hypothetical protein ADEAN_000926900 [Angomonas deanei]